MMAAYVLAVVQTRLKIVKTRYFSFVGQEEDMSNGSVWDNFFIVNQSDILSIKETSPI